MGTFAAMDVSIKHNPQLQRFEARLDGELVGFAAYRPTSAVLTFTHTEVDPRYRGRGIGGVLIGAALDQVRADGGRIQPLCSFVADYVDQHPEYADLVA